MSKSTKRLSAIDPIIIDGFPNDRIVRQITSVGPVQRRAEGEQIPLWNVSLSILNDDSNNEVEAYHTLVGAGFLKHLRIGSTWTGSLPDHPQGHRKVFHALSVDGSRQQIFIRVDAADGTPVFHPYGANVEGPAYVLMPVLSNETIRWVVVRCTEVFRAFFSSIGPIAKYVFDFTDNGNNHCIFHSPFTRKIDDSTFRIYRLNRISNEDAGVIGMFLFLDDTRRSIIDFAMSARSQMEKGACIWPVMRAPVSDSAEWRVFGQNKTLILEETDEVIEVFAVAQILSSKLDAVFPTVEVFYDGFSRKLAESTAMTFQSLKSDVADATPELNSLSTPGNEARVEQIENLFENMYEGWGSLEIVSTPVDQSERLTASHQTVIDYHSINQFGIPGRGSPDPSVGIYKNTVDGPSVKSVTNFPLGQLKEKAAQYGYLSPVLTPLSDVPAGFHSMISVLQYLVGLPILKTYILRDYDDTLIDVKFDKLCLLMMPVSWGAPAMTKSNEHGMRRLLCARLVTSKGGVLILDVERKSESGSARAHIYAFNENGKGVASIPALSALTYEYVVNKKWPVLNGPDVASAPLNHSSINCRSGNPVDDMRNRLVRKLDVLLGAKNI